MLGNYNVDPWWLNKVPERNGLHINESGDKTWYLNGKPHREDGPAYTKPSGYEEWLVNGKHHRLDGPAVTFPSKEHRFVVTRWFKNGRYYREDGGPVVEVKYITDGEPC